MRLKRPEGIDENINMKNNVPQLSHGMKNIYRSEVVTMTYTLRKSLLQLLLLKVFELFLIKQSKKTCSILGLTATGLEPTTT